MNCLIPVSHLTTLSWRKMMTKWRGKTNCVTVCVCVHKRRRGWEERDSILLSHQDSLWEGANHNCSSSWFPRRWRWNDVACLLIVEEEAHTLLHRKAGWRQSDGILCTHTQIPTYTQCHRHTQVSCELTWHMILQLSWLRFIPIEAESQTIQLLY